MFSCHKKNRRDKILGMFIATGNHYKKNQLLLLNSNREKVIKKIFLESWVVAESIKISLCMECPN